MESSLGTSISQWNAAIARLPWWARRLVRRASGPVDAVALGEVFEGAKSSGRPVRKRDIESTGVSGLASGLVLWAMWNLLSKANSPELSLIDKPSRREILPRPFELVKLVLRALFVQLLAFLAVIAALFFAYWWLVNR